MCIARLALPSELKELEALDGACFPEDDIDRARATPGELAAGLSAGAVTVIDDGGRLLAFLQVNQPSDRHLFIAALGVHPDLHGQGLGGHLLDAFLEAIPVEERSAFSISTVTSPRNLPMLHLLLSRGFVARTVMKAYFGADRDRLYCQLGVRHRFVDPDDQYLVPAEALDNLYKLLEMDNYVLTDVLSSPAGTLFEVSRFDSEDLAALQAAEAAAGISFSTAMLASLSFLLAFAFASARYPEGARVLLLIATLSCTASLIVYANASGDLARLRSNTFDQYMKWGNLLSEYGGVTPFILALPLTFANVTTSEPAAIGIAVLFSAALLIYELSRFALLKRYPRTILFVAPAIATSALPILSVLIPDEHPWTWIWTGAAVLLLFGRIMSALPSGAGEAVTPPKRWQVRR